jgi:hypothetical protein
VSFIDDYFKRTWVYFLELNMRFTLGLRRLKISWKIRLVGRLWCCGLIMEMSFFLSSLINFVRRMEFKDIRHHHIVEIM